MRICKILFFMFLFLSFYVIGATYYVSPSGDDANPGTKDKPWRTIQKAANTVSPGDNVLIMPGEYLEQVSVERSGKEGAYIVFKGEGAVESIKVKGFSVGGWAPKSTHYIMIDGLTILGGILLAGNYNIVQNCIFEGCGVGISWHPTAHPPAKGCIVRNNIFRNFGKIVLLGSGTKTEGCLWERNKIYNGEGDVWRIFGKGHIVRNNEVYGLNETGWHADIFQIYDNNKEISYDIIVENNYFHDCTGSLCMLLSRGNSELRSWVFRNNLIVNVGGVGQVGIPGCRFHNNTFINSGHNTAGPILFRYYTQEGNYQTGAHNTEVFNNLFIGCGSSPDGEGTGWYHFADRPKEELTNFKADYNYVTKTPSKNYVGKNGFSGLEKHGINGGDPKFVDVENKNFKLQPGSPAIDAGITIPDFSYDIEGTVRPQGSAWDIGAYEYVGSEPKGITPSTGIKTN